MDWNFCLELELGGLGGNVNEFVISGDITFDYAIVLTNLNNTYILKYIKEDDILIIHGKKMDSINLNSMDVDDNVTSNETNPLDEVLKNKIVSVSLYFGDLQFKSIVNNEEIFQTIRDILFEDDKYFILAMWEMDWYDESLNKIIWGAVLMVIN